MTAKLKDFIQQSKFNTKIYNLTELKPLNHRFQRTSSVCNPLTWLEVPVFQSHRYQIETNLPRLPVEEIIPSNYKSINSILGLRIVNLLNHKTNYSRLDPSLSKKVGIYWLELIGSYRGWRHMHGLPVRGQRTWSNAWSVYKSNLDLREFSISLTKNIYKTATTLKSSTLRLAYMAEHINKLWAVQWELEWKKARKKRINALKKDYKDYTVDLLRLASGNVNTKKVRKNRKKQAEEKKNNFYLGFDKGFTKYLLKYNTLEDNSTKVDTGKKTVSSSKDEKKNLNILTEAHSKLKSGKSSKKKKTDLQAKKRKNLLLKKKKKSVWD